MDNPVHPKILEVNQIWLYVAQPDKYDDTLGKYKGFLIVVHYFFSTSLPSFPTETWIKCNWCYLSGKCLGYMLSEQGVEMDKSKMEAGTASSYHEGSSEIPGFCGFLQMFHLKLQLCGYSTHSPAEEKAQEESVNLSFHTALFQHLATYNCGSWCFWECSWSTMPGESSQKAPLHFSPQWLTICTLYPLFKKSRQI